MSLLVFSIDYAYLYTGQTKLKRNEQTFDYNTDVKYVAGFWGMQ
jgi:hypothetical protein